MTDALNDVEIELIAIDGTVLCSRRWPVISLDPLMPVPGHCLMPFPAKAAVGSHFQIAGQRIVIQGLGLDDMARRCWTTSELFGIEFGGDEI